MNFNPLKGCRDVGCFAESGIRTFWPTTSWTPEKDLPAAEVTRTGLVLLKTTGTTAGTVTAKVTPTS